jgi:hypothetical protein
MAGAGRLAHKDAKQSYITTVMNPLAASKIVFFKFCCQAAASRF